MFQGCCLLSVLQCPRPSELARTRSYGLDHGASASALMGRCLWEESCWKGAAWMTAWGEMVKIYLHPIKAIWRVKVPQWSERLTSKYAICYNIYWIIAFAGVRLPNIRHGERHVHKQINISVSKPHEHIITMFRQNVLFTTQLQVSWPGATV